MTRYWAGGGPSDYTIVSGADVTIGSLDGKAAVVVGGVEITWWNSETGGTQYTDLLDSTGSARTSVLSSDTSDGRALGQIPRVQYPDNVTGAWASAAGGRRVWMAADVGDQAVATAVDLAAHKSQNNGHGTGVANLVDVSVPLPGSRNVGDLLGVVTGGGFGLIPPSAAAGAVLLNPPASGGSYVGNTAQPPDPAQGQSGNPWLKLTQPYSGADDNPDAVQFFSTSSTGQSIKTGWFNGNGELRAAPSLPNRVAGRVFEAYENRGGPSTGRFFELSTNPSVAANREALLGAYGTGNSTKPGWVEATRVLSGLQGVRAGGSYNSLSGVNFRGQKSGTGAPTTGTWVTGDAVVDSAGVLWLCTAGGTPGTWTGSAGGGGGGSTVSVMPTWTQDTATVGTGTYRVHNPTGSALTLRSAVASIGGTAPTGSSLIVQVRVDGTAVFTSGNRPTITAGNRYSGVASTFISANWPAGSYLTVDVDQVGSTAAGTKLTVQVLAY
ncbi:hypothetical protein GA0070622_1181 [Micromonospora sediminicola]|uniref:Uncharacterized protein n=1 Tax=Micromonospora sediminicola TaxID=946078 RepID=A0A1A9B572_9ACTN|nr:hypothetical protein [Micromonospora sediminicola]SBT64211.1 hypothetical protein GA0070622_1181 [Micromonospora sediminicola]